MKEPPRRTPGSLMQPPLINGVVTVSVTRKHSIRPYETLDVHISVTADVGPEEAQCDATMRIYKQLMKDVVKISNEMRDKAKEREL